MTFGDGFLALCMAVCAVAMAVQLGRDRGAGRSQVRHDVPVVRLWVGVALIASFGLVMAGFGVLELSTPGTTEVESGRLRGAEIHHATFGLLSLGIAGVAGWLGWTVWSEIRRRSSGTSPSVPVAPAVPPPVPTLQVALSRWHAVRTAPDPDRHALSAAARDLAGALSGTLPGSRTTTELVDPLPPATAEPLRTLLETLDRARFADDVPDLRMLDICVEAIAKAADPTGGRGPA